MKILVWLSGWVDSAVSAYLLKQAWHDVSAGFMINYISDDEASCTTKKDLEVAKEVAEYLGIPFFTFDYVKEYDEKILNYLYEGYKRWITPNPDVWCNSEVKFKLFLEEALEAGFDMVATGHYARIVPPLTPPYKGGEKNPLLAKERDGWGSTYRLLKWVDPNKDQSYFLSTLNQFQLSRTLFPIWHLQKSEVREIAIKAGLPNADRKDSQWLCFVWKVDFEQFLKKKIPVNVGNIVDTSGKILGKHDGVYFYTIGQRKWLDIGGLAKPVFVIKKDIVKNELIVGTEEEYALYSHELTTSSIHFIWKDFEFPYHGKAKIRYRQADQDVIVSPKDLFYYKESGEGIQVDGHWFIWQFAEAQRAVSSGQIVALYDGDELVASGIIE
jgi:tRNA-uridine 2-sulfurtransferase